MLCSRASYQHCYNMSCFCILFIIALSLLISSPSTDSSPLSSVLPSLLVTSLPGGSTLINGSSLNITSVATQDFENIIFKDCLYLDLSNNFITSIPYPSFNGSNWNRLSTLILSNNQLKTLLHGSPGPYASFSFLMPRAKDWVKVDLSNNPLTSLPTAFGSGLYFSSNSNVYLSLSNCNLTSLPTGSFQALFSTLDLSYNNFASPSAIPWTSLTSVTVGPPGPTNPFCVFTKLDFSHCGITTIPSTNIVLQAGFSNYDFSNTIIDFSYNPITSFSLKDNSFVGKYDFTHCNMTSLLTQSVKGSTLNYLDLSYNNFGNNMQNGVFVDSNIQTLSMTNANITSINSNVFSRLTVQTLDLTGNNFSINAFKPDSFSTITTCNSLILNRCSMTSTSLLAGMFNGTNVIRLYMENDNGDSTRATWNKFSPFPNDFFYSGALPFLTVLSIGEIYTAPKGMFNDWTTASLVNITLNIASSVDPVAISGPFFNALTGYSSLPLTPRLLFELKIAGALWSDTTMTSIVDQSLSHDILYPNVLYLPWHRNFIQRKLFASIPDLTKVVYYPPFLYSTIATGSVYADYSPSMSSLSIPYDLLCDATGLQDFTVRLGGARPVLNTALPADIFSCLTPAKGIGQLSSIDLSLSQFPSYPQTLLSGQTLPSFVAQLDMNVLYSGVDPVPVGFWDDLDSLATVSKGSSAVVSAQIIYNLASHCPYIVGQSCQTCPVGSYTSSVSGFYYCHYCAAGYKCNVTNTPCPVGTYQPSIGQSQCIDCPVGRYNPSTGQSQPYACVNCDAGKYSNATGASSSSTCQECPAGSASSVPGAAVCTSCSPGYYQSLTGQYTCVACPASTYRADPGAKNVSECEKCPYPTTVSQAASTAISACSTPTCSNGVYLGPTETNSCSTPCKTGYYCISGVSIACPVGTYAEGTGNSACTSCAAGKYSAKTAQSSNSTCISCPAGTYSSFAGSSSCVSCPQGAVSNVVGASNVTQCILCTNTSNYICAAASFEPILTAVFLPASVDFLYNTTSSRDSYTPIRGGPSLRLSTFKSDAILSTYKAGDSDIGSSSISHTSFDPTQDYITTQTQMIILIICCALAGLPLLLYREIPLKLTSIFDQYCLAHFIFAGGMPVKRPTQWGTGWTISFAFIAALVAINLGTSSNATITNALVPSSASDYTGYAQAAMQITLKAYAGSTSNHSASYNLDSWCANQTTSLIAESGFSHAASLKQVSDGQACVIAIDCVDCSVGGLSNYTFSVPYFNQILEWEVWVSGAVPYSWSRYYGVINQVNNSLLDAQAELHFSILESFYLDTRSSRTISQPTSLTKSLLKSATSTNPSTQLGSATETGSGYELNFLYYSQILAQDAAQLTQDSTVKLSFVFTKQDMVYQTVVSSKLTWLQILSSIIATVVSLFSIFALGFRYSERILGHFKISNGPYPTIVHILPPGTKPPKHHQLGTGSGSGNTVNRTSTDVKPEIDNSGNVKEIELMSVKDQVNEFDRRPTIVEANDGSNGYLNVDHLMNTHQASLHNLNANKAPVAAAAGTGAVAAAALTSGAGGGGAPSSSSSDVAQLRAQYDRQIANMQATIIQLQAQLTQLSARTAPLIPTQTQAQTGAAPLAAQLPTQSSSLPLANRSRSATPSFNGDQHKNDSKINPNMPGMVQP